MEEYFDSSQPKEEYEYLDLDRITGEKVEEFIAEAPRKLRNVVYATSEKIQNWIDEKRQYRVLKSKFSESLKQNLDYENKLIDDMVQEVDEWSKQVKEKLKLYHTTEPKKDLPLLTEENLNNFIEFYEHQKVLTYGDKEQFCDIFSDEYTIKSDSNDLAVSKPNMNCLQQLEKYKRERNIARTKEQYATIQKEGEERRKKICIDQKNSIQSEFNNCKNSLLDSKKDLGHVHEKIQLNNEKLEKYNTLESNKNKCAKELSDKNKEILKNQKELKIKDALINKKDRDYFRCKKRLGNYKKVELLSIVIGNLLEAILELLIWPYAIYHEKSIFNKVLKASGYKLGSFKRLILTGGVGILWTGLLFNYVFPNMGEIKKVEDSEEKQANKSGSKVNWPGPLKTKGHGAIEIRGGSQIMNSYDPIFMEIHGLKIYHKLTSNKKDRTGIIDKVKNNRVTIQVVLVAAIYLTGLITRPKISSVIVDQFIEENSYKNQIENMISDSIVEPEGTKIYLPTSNTVLGKRAEPTGKISKNISNKNRSKIKRTITKKKRVGKISDFSSQEFENAEILTNKLPLPKVKIRNGI